MKSGFEWIEKQVAFSFITKGWTGRVEWYCQICDADGKFMAPSITVGQTKAQTLVLAKHGKGKCNIA